MTQAGGLPPADDAAALAQRPEGFRRVSQWLAERGHRHAPRWLDVPARTCAEAAQALGVATGQIAKSVIFRRVADERAVLVIAAGDQRVDTAKVTALAGPVDRADAAFVKAATGFSIGGVAPVAHLQPPVVLVDQTLGRFDAVWAAAGHPNGVFCATPAELLALAGVAPSDVAEAAP
jgi:prolyl-tRNA editing enzyme YbaK/EbsC (Cys-tRNA(Pro) deacylase)